MMERWQDITGFDGLYQISDQGRVRKTRRSGKHGPKLMKLATAQNGYICVGLTPPGKRQRRLSVHRLVATEFLGSPPSPKHQVNHKDGDKANNLVGNLEWVTCGENHRHAYRNLGRGSVSPGLAGEAHPMARLKREQVAQIKHRLRDGQPRRDIATAFSVSVWTIRDIAQGRTWGDVEPATEPATEAA